MGLHGLLQGQLYLLFIYLCTSVASPDNSAGSLNNRYESFRSTNVPCFSPYSIPALYTREWYVEADV
jgi:hypothetical protein